MHYQAWGRGDPVIALHPLALESTAFAGVAGELKARGLRTLAVDLPGFGRSPAPEGRLTPAVLAAPVIQLARRLGKKGTRPLILGMSLGGRVALEAALQAPELFSGVVCVAPYLPWRTHTWAMPIAGAISPEFAAKIPLEKIWPLLKRVTESIEAREELEHDWLARASVRVIYYMSCAATRAAFFSAARELALDPALGTDGTWTRLRGLEVPASFLWLGRDALIPAENAGHVARALPRARQLELGCSGHFVHGAHYRCFNRATSDAIAAVLEAAERPRRRRRHATIQCDCLADTNRGETSELQETGLAGTA